ncbi:MAG TPA: hypothetical protein ENK99_06415 [Campylobacterales bacterium]|nr:hypothetical protein [Campylobacterales bacterium]
MFGLLPDGHRHRRNHHDGPRAAQSDRREQQLDSSAGGQLQSHDVFLGDNCILENGATLAGHVELGNNVVIGGLTPIHQFVHIGDYAMIAGASALSQDIPPYCLAEGNRASLRGLNLTGLRRNIDRDDINRLKIVYKELFESGEPLQDTAKKLLENEKSEIIKNLLEFVSKSKRGIPYTRKNING